MSRTSIIRTSVILASLLVVSGLLFKERILKPKDTRTWRDAQPPLSELLKQSHGNKYYSNEKYGFSFSYPENFTLENLEEYPDSFYLEICGESCYMSAENFLLVQKNENGSLSEFNYNAGWRNVSLNANPTRVISSQSISVGPQNLPAIERVVEYMVGTPKNLQYLAYRTWVHIDYRGYLLFSFSFDPEQEPRQTILKTFDRLGGR